MVTLGIRLMDDEGGIMPVRKSSRHYYGDTVRILFVLGAVTLFVAESVGAELPLSVAGTVTAAVILVVAAGITNPQQIWIHYVNELIAIVGTLIFAARAIEYWQLGLGALNVSYLFTEVMALLSIFALYFTTKTVRGVLLRPHFED